MSDRYKYLGDFMLEIDKLKLMLSSIGSGSKRYLEDLIISKIISWELKNIKNFKGVKKWTARVEKLKRVQLKGRL